MLELDSIPRLDSDAKRDVDRLTDYLAIRELTARYNRAVDDCRYGELAGYFAPDGVFEVVGFIKVEGRTKIFETMSKFGFGTVHLTSDATIDIQGNHATQVCSLVLAGRQQNRAAFRFLTMGRYVDTLVRTADGWRFVHRLVDIDLDITQMAASVVAKNFVSRFFLQGAARAIALFKRLGGKGWSPRGQP